MITSEYIREAMNCAKQFLWLVKEDYDKPDELFSACCKMPGYTDSYHAARKALNDAKTSVAKLHDEADTRKALQVILAALSTLPDTQDPLLLAHAALTFDEHKQALSDAALALEAASEFWAAGTDSAPPEVAEMSDSAKDLLRASMRIEAHAESVSFAEVEKEVTTSTTTNKISRKKLIDLGLLTQEGKGPQTKYRVTDRGFVVAEYLRTKTWKTY